MKYPEDDKLLCSILEAHAMLAAYDIHKGMKVYPSRLSKVMAKLEEAVRIRKAELK